MRVLLAHVLLLLLAGAASAQQSAAPQCLHGADESASERARREEALAFVDRVNAAQREAQQTQGTFIPLADAVPPGDVPLGFVPRLTIDRWSYAISLKDLFDPCGFALFSDQDGRVYEARPASRAGGASAEAPGGSGSRTADEPGAAHVVASPPPPRAGGAGDRRMAREAQRFSRVSAGGGRRS